MFFSKKNKKKSTPRKSKFIESVYEDIIVYDCPVRGRVEQKVLVKRYEYKEPNVKHFVSSRELQDQKFDDLSDIADLDLDHEKS